MSEFILYTTELKYSLDRLSFELVEALVRYLHEARIESRQVFVFGNGGSATTAMHFACDLGKNTVVPHLPRFRVMALTDNVAIFSAIANDLAYENVFSEQLANFVQPGDVVIAISASGNSPNVLKAIDRATAHHAFTVGWSGFDGGKLARQVDLPIVVPSFTIEQVEDIHLMLAHMVTVGVRKAAHNLSPMPKNSDLTLTQTLCERREHYLSVS